MLLSVEVYLCLIIRFSFVVVVICDLEEKIKMINFTLIIIITIVEIVKKTTMIMITTI